MDGAHFEIGSLPGIDPGDLSAWINADRARTVRTKFEEFICSNTNKKAAETNFRRKGSLGVALQVTDMIRSKNTPFPLEYDTFLASAGTQVKGLSGTAIDKILAKHGINRTLGTEVGRTNRGAPLHMRVYVDFLNGLQQESCLELDLIADLWIERVEEYFAASPFEMKLDPASGLRSVIRNLMKQAEERQRRAVGFKFAGTLAQHLVGAKLDLVLGESDERHHGANQNDVDGRHGDFLINDVCIHVTTAPGEALLRKCQANLGDGLRPIIVTVYGRIQVAEALAEDLGIGERIDIFEIEQFIASNMFELSLFQPSQRRVKVSELVKRYNAIIDKFETDPGLKIRFDV